MSATARLRAVLLDAAGTLIRPRVPVGETYAARARAHGLALPAWRLDDAFRRVWRAAPPMCFPDALPAQRRERERDWWRRLVRDTFRATDQTARIADFDALFEDLWAHYARPEAWQALRGARSALDALRASGRTLAVLSNADHRLIGVLEGLDLRAPFACVVLPVETGVAKPDPRAFAAALERLGASAAEAVSVGDDLERDVAAARRAGLRAIAVDSPATLGRLAARIEALEQEASA